MYNVDHHIDGEAVQSHDNATFESINPWTQRPSATIARGAVVDAHRAVSAARMAFDSGPWPAMTPDERAAHLHRLADLIEAEADELAMMDTAEMGRPISQSLGADVPRAARNLRFFADFAKLAEAEAVPIPGHHAYTQYSPVGVAAAISPWNFPLMQGSWKIAPALAFGNTVVLKPAEQAPTSCTRMAQLATEAGIPNGVLNVINGFGPGEAGEGLTSNSDVDLITFTGESATGRAIMSTASQHLTRLSFELGGKGASVVFDDADLDRIIPWTIKAIFLNSGQVCLSGSRLYVQRGIYDEFMNRFTEAARALNVGDPTDPTVDIGPLSSQEHWRKVCSYLEIAEHEGARVVTGGNGSGWTVEPTVLVDVDQQMRVCREEIFGPVVSVVPFNEEDEAIELVNDSEYGLSAMVFSENVRRAHRVAGAIRAGNVWVNCYFVRDLRLPFGGMKNSGIGREGGRHSMEFFTEAKSIVMEL